MKRVSKIFMCLAILPLCMMIVLSGCGSHTHEWSEATCTSPKTCTVCGEKEGEPLGHTWQAATCIKAKTCSTCGATEGKAAGHSWQAATCTKPKTCSICGITDGTAQHTWQAATCTKPKTCSVCGTTEGKATGHSGVFRCTKCNLSFVDIVLEYVQENGEYYYDNNQYGFTEVDQTSSMHYVHGYIYDVQNNNLIVSIEYFNDEGELAFALGFIIEEGITNMPWLLTYYSNGEAEARMYGYVNANKITMSTSSLPYIEYSSSALPATNAIIGTMNKMAVLFLQDSLSHLKLLLMKMPEGITLYNLGFTSY